ncbi:MAG: hypothetical protein GOMPHAMPRED_002863 [Gomphillus americanus]|uniref:Protein kinase domain-containing protein n=1 Tax=Gomphillus americanus TaxID=1940652 RepID=A0A8H3I8S1_9LECA|nr:MAG: hypothetical protein GOMPHAMPRED_002863 [Gomphillus americanus]
MAKREALIAGFIADARRIHPDSVAVLITRLSLTNSFGISPRPDVHVRSNEKLISGHIFSQDLAGEIRTFGLIDPPAMIRNNKFVCWNIHKHGLILPPILGKGDPPIDATLTFDEEGFWAVHKWGGQSLTVGGKPVHDAEEFDLPSHGSVDLVFAGKIKGRLYFTSVEINLYQELSAVGVYQDNTSEATTEILRPSPTESSNDDSIQESIQGDTPEPLEVAYSKEVREHFPASGTNHNLLFKNKNTVVNWYQSHKSQIRIVVKTVLKPRKLSWEKETQMGRYKHPHIIQLWYHSTNPHQLFLEYVPAAKDLSAFCRNSQCTLNHEEAVQVLEEIASALTYLHGRNLAHNDIKPLNIIYSRELGAKLIDFGLCEHFGIASPGGTPGFIPPERWDGYDTKQVSHTQDVYGLGIVMYWVFRAMPMPKAFWNIYKDDVETINRKAHHFEEIAQYKSNWKPKNKALKDMLSSMCHDNPEYRPQASSILDTIQGIRSSVKKRTGK